MAGRVSVVVVFLSLALSAGCHRTLKSSVTQPNPLAQPHETLRESEEITIITGDMDLNVPKYSGPQGNTVWINEPYPLRNKARFTVVSRDRLRFHVQIEHKWQEYVDLEGWDAVLIDDKGRRYLPDDVDQVGDKHIVKMWDYETRTAVRNRYGDITHVLNDGWKNRQTLGSLSVFRGRGDLVFYHRDIFSSDVKQLTLLLSRGGVTFEFTWRFTDTVPDLPENLARR